MPAASVAELDAAIARNQAELERARGEYDGLIKRVRRSQGQAAAGRRPADAQGSRRGCGARPPSCHSPPITVEMTFNVYRTTKGKIGEPVYAEIEAINPRTRQRVRGRRLPDQGVLHQPGAASRLRSWPARAARCGSRSAA